MFCSIVLGLLPVISLLQTTAEKMKAINEHIIIKTSRGENTHEVNQNVNAKQSCFKKNRMKAINEALQTRYANRIDNLIQGDIIDIYKLNRAKQQRENRRAKR